MLILIHDAFIIAARKRVCNSIVRDFQHGIRGNGGKIRKKAVDFSTAFFYLSNGRKSLAEFRARRREKIETRFFRRRVRRKKHFARSLCRIVRFQRATEAQSAAKLSQKRGVASFLKTLVFVRRGEGGADHFLRASFP